MRQRRTFLFAVWDGGGNIPPQMAIVRGLALRGHRVLIHAPGGLRSVVEDAGAVFEPYRNAPEHDSRSPLHDLTQDWEPRTPIGVAARVRDRVLFGPMRLYAQDVLAILEREAVDVVVSDFMLFGAYVAAELTHRPLVSLVHSVYPFRAPGLPPFGMGLSPANSLFGRLRDRVLGKATSQLYEAGRKQVNEVRTGFGMAKFDSVFRLLDIPRRTLVLSSPAFDFPAISLPGNVRYIGAPRSSVRPESKWESPWPGSDKRPLVLVSLSTTYQDQSDLLSRLVRAVSELPVNALVTVGPALDIQRFHAPSNVVIEKFVPHASVLPAASLVVTHAGHGTVMSALAHGVPLVCTPIGRDQPDVAARVVWRGVGVKVSVRSTVQVLREAMAGVLENRKYAERAQQLSKRLQSEDAVRSAVDELEMLAVS